MTELTFVLSLHCYCYGFCCCFNYAPRRVNKNFVAVSYAIKVTTRAAALQSTVAITTATTTTTERWPDRETNE